ncbi:hypothetical protein [Desulfosoma sp.]
MKALRHIRAAVDRHHGIIGKKFMGVRDSIRKQRQKGKTPEVFQPDAFTRVAAVLMAFGGDEKEFLRRLDEEPASETAARALARGALRKTPVPVPLFALVVPESYAAVETITARVDGPYLAWAESPDDLLLCRALYAVHPKIAPRLLSRYAYAFLYRFYAAKRRALEASYG